MPWPDRVAEEIRRQLRMNLGLEIIPSVVESEAFLSAVDSGQIPGLFLLGWGADFPEVTNFLDTHFGSRATAAFGNPFPDILEALEKGAHSPEENRAQYYAIANGGIKAHVPVIPLAQGGWDSQESLGVVYQKEVEGANSSFYGTEAMHLLWSQNRQAFTWLQPKEPVSLYCPDEVDPASRQACAQVTETLYRLEPGGLNPKPNLAEICVLDETLLVWTCSMRQGIQFHDASYLDANDVVTG